MTRASSLPCFACSGAQNEQAIGLGWNVQKHTLEFHMFMPTTTTEKHDRWRLRENSKVNHST
jgi:hypothetical protein